MDDEKKKKVAAVIVTHNRKELLCECLDAVLSQTRPVEAVYIIDNASTDDTPEYLTEKGFIDKPISPEGAPEEEVKTLPLPPFPDKTVEIHYVRMHENTGGAGGFHEGVKRCHESGFDWVWLMDDDGIPAEDQLAELLDKSVKNNLLMVGPLVIDNNNEQVLTFRRADMDDIENSVDALKAYAVNGIIYNCIFAFNGTLISMKVVEKIGNIKREMFIWGDEKEYVLRAESNNIKTGTVITALHRHPARIASRAKVLFGFLGKVSIRTDPKAHIYYRNLGYQHGKYYSVKKKLKILTKYTFYFLINSRLDIKELIKFYRYYLDGVTDRFLLPPKRKQP
ncbi:Glycosyl transferase, family 2? [hydrothermal vent metagenome]|uniref:Glycosyl transferase, family 2 n=1 Tax=hydrothermal vent metagenome TaxID=652676 RepID=A0A3B1DNS6_9ZZZZ